MRSAPSQSYGLGHPIVMRQSHGTDIGSRGSTLTLVTSALQMRERMPCNSQAVSRLSKEASR